MYFILVILGVILVEKKQSVGVPPAYSPPKVMRLSDMDRGSGCHDTCKAGSSAEMNCNTNGTGAYMECDTHGSSATLKCIGQGSGAIDHGSVVCKYFGGGHHGGGHW